MMETDIRLEIIALHHFFQEWFNAHLPHTEAAFTRFSSVIGRSFYIIPPDGRLTLREQLMTGLWDAHGRWLADKGTIHIKNVVLRRQYDDLALATYEEWQQVSGITSARLSTALFRPTSAGPYPLMWQFVHETWLPGETL